MKYFSILSLILAITLTLSACGAQATPPPTISAVDMQNTAAALAFTMVSGTQAAIPTATPPPPTETFTNTPPPTNTFLPQPSLEAPASAVTVPTLVPTVNSGSGDPCVNQALPGALQGRQVKIRVNNSTKVALTLSVYLNQTIPEHVCGYRIYTLEPQQSIVIKDLVEGCFTLWAWNPDPKHYFIVTNGASTCIMNTDTPVFSISTSTITNR